MMWQLLVDRPLPPGLLCEYLFFFAPSPSLIPDSDPYPALRHLTVYRVLVTAPSFHGRLGRYHRKTDATALFHDHTVRRDATVSRTNFAMLMYLILPIPVFHPPSPPPDILLGLSPHLHPHHLAYGFGAVVDGRWWPQEMSIIPPLPFSTSVCLSVSLRNIV